MKATLRAGKQPAQPVHLEDLTGGGVFARVGVAFPAGAAAELEVPEVGRLDVKVGRVAPDAGGYLLELVPSGGAWPFAQFGKLANWLASTETPAAPPCAVALGLKWPCGLADVERAYFGLIRIAHPDRGGSLEHFVRINQAYREARKLVSRRA